MSRLTDKAVSFATAIVGHDTAVAYGMLSDDLADQEFIAELADQVKNLTEDMGGVTAIGEAMVLMEDWPERASNDIAVVYVPLQGDTYSEAVTVTLADFNGELRITSVELGRP